jgi:hypothetical protein
MQLALNNQPLNQQTNPPLLPNPTSQCNPNPCMNGGQCSETGYTFVCTCAPQYTGTTCNILVSPQPSQSILTLIS